MAAPRRTRPKLPNGQPVVLRQGVGQPLGFEVLDRPGVVRDLTNDTLTVSSKLNGVAKTLTAAADSPATAGKGTLTIPSSEVDASGMDMFVDIKGAKVGGEAEVLIAWKIEVEDSPAD